MRFREKVAIVTGGGEGVGGAEIALMFAREGATAIMFYHGDTDLEEVKRVGATIPSPGKLVSYEVDVRFLEPVKETVDLVHREYGRIDILVNNAAGIPEYGEKIEESSVKYFKRLILWNLTSQFVCCKAIVPIMKAQHYGRIVNVSCIAALRGTLTDDIAYPAAKAGVIGLTKELARYLGPFGITVNVIVPPEMMNEMLPFSTMPKGLWPITEDEYRARYSRVTPLRRLPEASEIAQAILFLASDDARYVTGETLKVTGGFHLSNVPPGGILNRQKR